MATPTIQFGSALGSYPRGALMRWHKAVTLRRRPEQDGANVGTAGHRPQLFPIMALLFGNTAPEVSTEYSRWEAELGNVKTLTRVDSGTARWHGTVLHSIRPVHAIKRIALASNGASYMQWINLVFAVVSESS